MQYPVEPFVISGEGVLTPPDRERWVTEEMFTASGQTPTFTVIEVANCFFGKSPVWLRKRLWEIQYEPTRTDSNHRRFGLHQVEEFAYILLENNKLSPLHFAMAIRIIKSIAILNLYEIGDSGFLLSHWNGAQMPRRQAITLLMERLEEADADRAADPPLSPQVRKALSKAVNAITQIESIPREKW
jgi:hypothetical protein